MNEPRVEQWMRDAAEAIVPESHVYFGASHEAERSTRLDAQERAREVRRVSELIAQHAPPDCERMLFELGEATGGFPVKVSIRPRPCQEATREQAVSVAFYDENHHRQEGCVSAHSILAAIRAAREAMGR